MRFETLRTLLLVAISLLVASEFLAWLLESGSWIAGVVSSLGVAAVYIYCGRRARAGVGYHGWILVPTLIFTVIPAGIHIWEAFGAQESSWMKELWKSAPFILSFLLPIGLLVLVYMELGRRMNAAKEQ